MGYDDSALGRNSNRNDVVDADGDRVAAAPEGPHALVLPEVPHLTSCLSLAQREHLSRERERHGRAPTIECNGSR